MKKLVLFSFLVALAPRALTAQNESPLLLQSPTLSQTQIAFAYGGNLWTVARDGGEARRLIAADPGTASGPLFSPDGKLVAFTGEFDGNQDVYVVPAGGGELKRLTSHPGTDVAVAWSPDGKRVLFRSSRDTYSRFEKLLTVPVEGGLPAEVPVPMGVQGAYSAEAAQLAYVPRWNRRNGAGDAYIAIKNYRGGKTSPLWIAQLLQLVGQHRCGGAERGVLAAFAWGTADSGPQQAPLGFGEAPVELGAWSGQLQHRFAQADGLLGRGSGHRQQ